MSKHRLSSHISTGPCLCDGCHFLQRLITLEFARCIVSKNFKACDNNTNTLGSELRVDNFVAFIGVLKTGNREHCLCAIGLIFHLLAAFKKMLKLSLYYLFPLSPAGGKEGRIRVDVPIERCFSWAPVWVLGRPAYWAGLFNYLGWNSLF